MSGDAQSGSAFRLLPAVFCKLKNPCQAHRLRGGIVCGEALGAAAKSVLHLQKDRCFKEKKICGSSSALLLLTGNDVPWGVGCSSQECSAFAEGPLLERCRKSCEDFETAEALRLELPRAPSPRILHLKLSRVTSTQNLPSETPSRHLNPESPSETPLHPFNKYSKPLYISKSKVTDVSTSRPLSAAFLVPWTVPQSEITTPSYSHSSRRI